MRKQMVKIEWMGSEKKNCKCNLVSEYYFDVAHSTKIHFLYKISNRLPKHSFELEIKLQLISRVKSSVKSSRAIPFISNLATVMFRFKSVQSTFSEIFQYLNTLHLDIWFFGWTMFTKHVNKIKRARINQTRKWK